MVDLVTQILGLIILSIWLMLPAYIPNNAAALFGGGTPIDFGRKFSDGKRVLGDGKTYKGFILGSLCGLVVGLLEIITAPYIAPHLAGFVDPDLFMRFSLHRGDHIAGRRAFRRYRQELFQAAHRL